MLRGELIGLRAITTDDLAVLQTEVFNNGELMLPMSRQAWRPSSLEQTLARHAPTAADAATTVRFAIEELATGELAGSAQLWGIDTYNRVAHLGFLLLPAFQGRGLGKDTIHTLCDYGFRVYGLHRLQIETLASNASARAASEAVGFVLEGRLRRNVWLNGEFVDEVLYGLLAEEWAVPRPKLGQETA